MGLDTILIILIIISVVLKLIRIWSRATLLAASKPPRHSGQLIDDRKRDQQGKPIGASDIFQDGRRRIIIPGFRSTVLAFMATGLLDESIGVASYHSDDKYFGLQVLGNWLKDLQIESGDLLVFENSREMVPGQLLIYSTQKIGPFKFGIYREGSGQKITPLYPNTSYDLANEVPAFVYGHKIKTLRFAPGDETLLPGG